MIQELNLMHELGDFKYEVENTKSNNIALVDHKT